MEENKESTITTEDRVILQLFVSGMSQKSMEAIQNIKHLCDEHLKDIFELEIIDIYKNPEILSDQHIIFSPSLVKQLPLPRKVLIGNFADTEKVIRGLGIVFNNKKEE
jgi:circadian clock protein KaiB